MIDYMCTFESYLLWEERKITAWLKNISDVLCFSIESGALEIGVTKFRLTLPSLSLLLHLFHLCANFNWPAECILCECSESEGAFGNYLNQEGRRVRKEITRTGNCEWDARVQLHPVSILVLFFLWPDISLDWPSLPHFNPFQKEWNHIQQFTT